MYAETTITHVEPVNAACNHWSGRQKTWLACEGTAVLKVKQVIRNEKGQQATVCHGLPRTKGEANLCRIHAAMLLGEAKVDAILGGGTAVALPAAA